MWSCLSADNHDDMRALDIAFACVVEGMMDDHHLLFGNEDVDFIASRDGIYECRVSYFN